MGSHLHLTLGPEICVAGHGMDWADFLKIYQCHPGSGGTIAHRLFTHSAIIMMIAAVIHPVSTRGWTLYR